MRLLKIELLKLKANYTLHGYLAVYFIMTPLILALMGQFDISSLGIEVDPTDMYKFPYNWELIPYIASWLNLILSIGVISFVALEFSAGMYKKTFIDGLSREELYLGKLLTVFVLTVFCSLYLLILISGFGMYYSEPDAITQLVDIEPLILYFFQAFCYFSFALFLVTWLKNATTAILFFIGYYFIEWFISIPLDKSLEIFLPFDAISEIVPIPFIDKIIGQVKVNEEPVSSNLYLAPYVSGVYLVLMQSATYLIMKWRSL